MVWCGVTRISHLRRDSILCIGSRWIVVLLYQFLSRLDVQMSVTECQGGPCSCLLPPHCCGLNYCSLYCQPGLCSLKRLQFSQLYHFLARWLVLNFTYQNLGKSPDLPGYLCFTKSHLQLASQCFRLSWGQCHQCRQCQQSQGFTGLPAVDPVQTGCRLQVTTPSFTSTL